MVLACERTRYFFQSKGNRRMGLAEYPSCPIALQKAIILTPVELLGSLA